MYASLDRSILNAQFVGSLRDFQFIDLAKAKRRRDTWAEFSPAVPSQCANFLCEDIPLPN
jgi:hypothetical protein